MEATGQRARVQRDQHVDHVLPSPWQPPLHANATGRGGRSTAPDWSLQPSETPRDSNGGRAG